MQFEVVDKQTTTFLALPNHRFGRHLAKARRLGRTTFHAALVIGVDPVIAYTCPIQVPDGTNDFEVVGGMAEYPRLCVEQVIRDEIPDIRRSRRTGSATKRELILVLKKG